MRFAAPAVSLFSLVTSSVLVTACGPGGLVPVKAPTVASAIADKAPLVVDWPAGQRTDLEVSTHDGVAVVRVEPTSIKLLRDCHLSGSYGFLAVSTKEQVIRLDDAADVALSLPLRGTGLAADLSGELGTSTALDVALVTIGRRRTIRTSAPRSALTGGECTGATHYIRGFDVGAFVLATSEKSSASTVAGLFGAKGSYARKSAKAVRETDGTLDACKAVEPGAKAPPAQCSAALRLDLKALDEDESVDTGSCGNGLVRAAGKCTTKAKVAPKVAFECNPANEDECREQCDAGNAASCGHYATSMRHSTSKAPDFKAIGAVAERGCSGGSERACLVLGELAQYGNGVSVDFKRASELYEKACTTGEAGGCFRHGVLYDRRPGLTVDYEKASELYDRACRGGDADGCNNLGALAVAGHGTAASPEKARTIYEEACKNGSAAACGNLGDLHASGLGGPKDPTKAADLWTQACAKSGTHCIRLGDATSGAGPLPKDPMRSVDAYQKGMKLLSAHCNLGVADRCDELGWLFHDGRAVPRDDAQALVYVRKGCDLGSPNACNHVGIFLEQGWGVAPNKLEAESKFKQACDAGNLRACVSFALLGPGAKGRQALIERACEGGVAEGCFHQSRLERIQGSEYPSSSAGKRIEKACTDGYIPACAYFGRWSIHTSSDRAAGMKHLEAACEKTDLGACASLAEALVSTKGSAERAEMLARRACDGGIARACRSLADMTSSDPAPLLQKACDGRDLTACVRLGQRITAAEPGRAASLLQRACDTSAYSSADLTKAISNHVIAGAAPVSAGAAGMRSSEAPGTLSGVGELRPGRGGSATGGLAGSTGTGRGSESWNDGIDHGRSGSGHVLGEQRLTRDRSEVERALDRADASEPTGEDQYAGCVTLGEMHEKGIGFTADALKAEKLYGVACAHGEGLACTRLGAIEEHAKSKDRTKLTALYGRGCELDDAEGCLKFGALAAASSNHLERLFAPESFEMACDLGSGDGCYRAAVINESDRHREAALELFDKACEKKEPKGCAAAKRLRPSVEAARAAAEKRRPSSKDRGEVRFSPSSASVPINDADRAIAAMRSRIWSCYQRGLNQDPSLSGKLAVSLKIDPSGNVTASQVVQNAGLSGDVAACVVAIVKNAHFDPPSSTSTLLIPMMFTAPSAR